MGVTLDQGDGVRDLHMQDGRTVPDHLDESIGNRERGEQIVVGQFGFRQAAPFNPGER